MKPFVLGIVGLVVCFGAGCRSAPAPEAPVAAPGFSAARPRVALGSPVDVTYKFKVLDNAPAFSEDYRVMVHFLDPAGELMWTDDHQPPTPTTKWTAGQSIEYTRTMFVPIYPYIGQTTVEMGIYSLKSGKRLSLEGQDLGQRGYKVGLIELAPQTDNIFLIFKDGWNPAEVSEKNATVEWQWSKKEGVIAFRNPKRDAVFFLAVDGTPSPFDSPQQVRVTVGEQTEAVDQFAITSTDEMLRKIQLPAAVLGTGDMTEIKIAVDKTFVPALVPAMNNRDPRELGVRVFHAFVEVR